VHLPKPAELAARIVSDVVDGVRPDLAPVRAHLAERLLELDGQDVWAQAEGIATEALAGLWEAELGPLCARGLGDAHELALVQAQRCLDASRDLEEHGVESWIAGAVLHRLAFDVSWDVLAEGRLDPSEEGCPLPGTD
jgi:hypothetical protein